MYTLLEGTVYRHPSIRRLAKQLTTAQNKHSRNKSVSLKSLMAARLEHVGHAPQQGVVVLHVLEHLLGCGQVRPAPVGPLQK